MYIIMQSIFLWTSFDAKTVSIFILTEGDAGGFFIILWIPIYLLFAHVNNKAGMHRGGGVMAISGTFDFRNT
jgi:hypothetical protein